MARIWLNQTPSEFQLLLAVLRSHKTERILEIGAESGGSLLMLITELNPSRAVSVGRPHPNIELVTELAPYPTAVYGREGDSHEPGIVDWVHAMGQPYDFVFIDGDHSYEGAAQDWRDYGLGCTAPGSIVAIHDIIHDTERGEPLGCVRLWDEIKDQGFKTLEIAHRDAACNGIGVIWV